MTVGHPVTWEHTYLRRPYPVEALRLTDDVQATVTWLDERGIPAFVDGDSLCAAYPARKDGDWDIVGPDDGWIVVHGDKVKVFSVGEFDQLYEKNPGPP